MNGYLRLLRDQRLVRETLRGQQQRSRPGAQQTYASGETAAAIERFHPASLQVRVVEERRETPSTKTLGVAAVEGTLPPYLPGQYISVLARVGGAITSRPMSLSSSPSRTERMEITIKAKPGGVVSPYLVERVHVGDRLTVSSPAGEFHHDPVRDSDELVFVAGGSGVTPFMGMAEYLVDRRPRARMLLLYGSLTEDEIIFRDRLAALVAQSASQLSVVHVLSQAASSWKGERGLLDVDLLRRQLGAFRARRPTFFVCGPTRMNELVRGALAELGVPAWSMRIEASSPPDEIAAVRGWPRAVSPEATVSVEVRGRGAFEARTGEPLMSALERQGVQLPALCRSGVCGRCRTRLRSGRVFTAPGVAVRPTDRAGGFIYPCVCYPLENVVLGK